MLKTGSCIYLLPLFPLLNKEETKPFDSFSGTDSVNLYSALYSNLKEIIENLSDSTTSVFCFDETDRDFLLPEYMGIKKVFFNLNDKPVLLKILTERYFNTFKNNLIIFANTISISPKEILKLLDLLNREDESFIIGKSHNNKVSYLGFNVPNSDLLQQAEATDWKFDNFLHLACGFDYFITALNGSLFIEDKNDFKILYKELSKKESLSYCSQNIHEKFTHLFIEYKELLKC